MFKTKNKKKDYCDHLHEESGHVCTSALNPSSSGTSASVLHRTRDNMDDNVMMVMMMWVQGCLDAIFFMVVPKREWWKMSKTRQNSQKQVRPAGRNERTKCCGIYSLLLLLLLHLITNLRNKWAMCTFFGVGASEGSKNNQQCGTQIKEHLQTLGKKHTNPFPVAGSPIWPGPAASWLIQVFIQQFLSRIQLTLKPAGKWTRPCPLSRRSQWLISSRELSNKSCSNKSQSSFCKHRSGHRNHQPLKLRSLFNCC